MRKGQGSLEYLILVGGTILVTVIVISLVLSSIEVITKEVDSGFKLFGDIRRQVATCEGGIEVDKTLVIQSDSIAIVNIEINEQRIVKSIVLTPSERYDQTYTIFIDSIFLGGVEDYEEYIESLVLDGLNQQVNPESFQFKIQRDLDFEVDLTATITLCES